ncbi:MAG: hypothetical protein IJM27_03610 [Eubacterium sp.]|nr:hypothetical protein [Eubacterium sp.]
MADDFVKQLNDYVDGCVRHYLETPENLKGFLTFLAGFRSNVSTRNKILTMGYNPAATEIRTKEDWGKQGVEVNDETAVIYNIQQNKEGGYKERIMYDVSATDEIPTSYEQFPNAGFFAERLILYPPCPIRFREPPLNENRKASYEPEKGIIEVTCGYKSEEHVCYGLLREFAHYYLRENEMQMSKNADGHGHGKIAEYDRDRHGIEALAVSYAICTRYGIQPADIEVVHPPDGKPKDLLRILEGLDRAIQKISKLIDDGGKEHRRFFQSDNTVEEGSGQSDTTRMEQPKNHSRAHGRG